MLDNIPLHIQSEIMKRLPVKSLMQFRSVSPLWKSFIDDPEFRRYYVRNYHINHTNPQHHLLVRYRSDNVHMGHTYTSIVDDNSFPEQRLNLIAPESLTELRHTLTLTSDDGLLCFYGYYGDEDVGTWRRAVIWNPTVGRSVGIGVYPNTAVVGFGVCHGDPKLVRIISINDDGKISWDVDVFSLSTLVWTNVHKNMEPFVLSRLQDAEACLNGVFYFRAYEVGPRSNCLISFNLESGEFGNVPFPDNLVDKVHVQAAKVNESLGILWYHDGVCEVWTKEEGANVTFDMKYTVEVEGQPLFYSVLEFRNNGEVLLEESRIDVYNPLLGHITIGDIGINGRRRTFSARSYMESARLLDLPYPHIIIPPQR